MNRNCTYMQSLITHSCLLGMPLMPTSGFACTSSSHFGEYYLCNKAYDNNEQTSWFTDREQLGAWVSVQFDLARPLAKLEIRHPYGGTLEQRNVKEIKLTFSENDAAQYATLSPATDPEWNVVNINPVVNTSFVKIEVQSVYVSSATQLRGFSEIKFYESSGEYYQILLLLDEYY